LSLITGWVPFDEGPTRGSVSSQVCPIKFNPIQDGLNIGWFPCSKAQQRFTLITGVVPLQRLGPIKAWVPLEVLSPWRFSPIKRSFILGSVPLDIGVLDVLPYLSIISERLKGLVKLEVEAHTGLQLALQSEHTVRVHFFLL
jgi:hypothetical protein